MEDKSIFAIILGALITVTGKAFSWVVTIFIGLPLLIGIYIGGSMMLRKFMRINSFKWSWAKGVEIHFDASRPEQKELDL